MMGSLNFSHRRNIFDICIKHEIFDTTTIFFDDKEIHLWQDVYGARWIDSLTDDTVISYKLL